MPKQPWTSSPSSAHLRLAHSSRGSPGSGGSLQAVGQEATALSESTHLSMVAPAGAPQSTDGNTGTTSRVHW